MMRALTLTQPWATAVALGSKRVETRSWSTGYRGEIAIHAAKGYKTGDLMYLGCCWNWTGALWQTGHRMGGGPSLDEVLPFGKIVAVAAIVACRPTDSFTQAELDQQRYPDGKDKTHYGWTERQMGDFSLGRFGFVLDDIRPLATPVAARGMLNLWNVPSDVEAAVRVQLPTTSAAVSA